MRALIFDLDGTLIDTVYTHVFAWQRAFAEAGMAVEGWRLHRRIGMDGELFIQTAAQELGQALDEGQIKVIRAHHAQLFAELHPERRPLPGAVALLALLRRAEVVHGIATSGQRPEINPSLDALEVPAELIVVGRNEVARGKPEPDLFLSCAERLGVPPADCIVVGDAVWDLIAAKRAGMRSIAVLTGGYGQEELLDAGAARVYRDTAALHLALREDPLLGSLL